MKTFVLYTPPSSLELKQWHIAARKQYGLPNQYRSKDETAVMPRMLPGNNPTGKRFCQYQSIVENYVQLASEVSSAYSQAQAIKTVETSLGVLCKATFFSIKKSDRDIITDLCLFAILNPNTRKHTPLTPVQKSNSAFQALKNEHFRAYYSNTPPQYDIFNLTPAQNQAYQLFSEVFTKPADIRPQMEQFFSTLPALAITNRWSAIQMAAYAHNQIIRIHPFVDGNGRTARFIANQILLKYGLAPFIDVKKTKTIELDYDKTVASNNDQLLVNWLASYQPPADVAYYPAYLYSLDNDDASRQENHQTSAAPSDVQLELDPIDEALLITRRPARGLFFQPTPLSYDLPPDYLTVDASGFKPKALS